MSDYRHRCTAALCPYLGQLTDNLSCGCHRKESDTMREELTRLTIPRPISEYHEDMGNVLWWCWRDGAWLGEPPYVGSPGDCGFEVLVHVNVQTIIDVDLPATEIRHHVGGWPGYHTHFTPLPPMPRAVLLQERK